MLAMQDIYGESKLSVMGAADASLQASTFGTDRKQMLSNLNGLSHFNVRDGAIIGIDVSYFVESANALIRRESLDNIQNSRQTPFTNFTGSAVIKNGVANSNDLLFTSSLFVTKASGVIDLTSQMIDYQMQVLPIRTGKIKWAIPLLLTGDLHNPNIHLDKLKLELLIAKDQLEEVKSKIHEEVQELPAKADKFLKKLMGN
jgi:AsmA protein